MGLVKHPRTAAALAAAAFVLAAGVAPAAAAPAARPSNTALPGCGEHDAVRRALRTLADGDHLAGAAVEVTDPVCGRWSDATGTADLDTGRPMTARDRLRVGSVTKTFTATVVLQLAAEHRIDPEAPIDRYVPGLISGNGYDGRRITVRQLLQHTSGLPDYLDSLDWAHPERLRYHHFEPRELITRALGMPHPITPAGSSFHYATTNYLAAGLIIEKVTGRSAESEITRRIIRPLGLRDTSWPGDDPHLHGPHSHSYWVPEQAAGRTDGTDWNMTFAGTGGALVSSPADLEHFFAALLGGRLLPPAQLAAMQDTVAADPDRLWPGARYGLGLISSPLRCGGVWWGHAGTVPGGHRALGAVGPGGRRVAVALTQVPSTERAEEEFRGVVEAALCEGRRPDRAPTTPARTDSVRTAPAQTDSARTTPARTASAGTALVRTAPILTTPIRTTSARTTSDRTTEGDSA
ncbi:serine hydrolase domain-containing protein [Streptomyces sp. SPB162]|uniref:serine hydrolase domain-containing protein n=1 Tax=Streptomyces sp. SPB162 TaxID=2940560 RepID=UPI0024054F0C|nr:serine hydrolase domain-containing protein [Streptomyces sp. SPB162]MDF9810801.1 D-alanyl-D-alanine carboxypeptidase [Streptomyces sp. SPB162]